MAVCNCMLFQTNSMCYTGAHVLKLSYRIKMPIIDLNMIPQHSLTENCPPQFFGYGMADLFLI